MSRNAYPSRCRTALLAALLLTPTLPSLAQPGDNRGPNADRPGYRDHGNRDQSAREPFGDEPADPDLIEEPSEHDRKRFEELFKDPEKLIAVVRDIDPALADQLEALNSTRPRAIFSVLRRQFPTVMRLALLKDEDPQLYQLRVRDLQLTRHSDELAEQYREAKRRDDKQAADDIADQLEPIVEEHFDVRQQARQREVQKLEERLEQLKDALDERDDNKRDLIKQRLAELLDNRSGRGW
jgi:hypothetical protein